MLTHIKIVGQEKRNRLREESFTFLTTKEFHSIFSPSQGEFLLHKSIKGKLMAHRLIMHVEKTIETVNALLLDFQIYFICHLSGSYYSESHHATYGSWLSQQIFFRDSISHMGILVTSIIHHGESAPTGRKLSLADCWARCLIPPVV